MQVSYLTEKNNLSAEFVCGGPANVEEFLYMDPDTGMTVCMVADGDGFRPATAMQEWESLPKNWAESSSYSVLQDSSAADGWMEELNAVEEFIRNFENSFVAPSAA